MDQVIRPLYQISVDVQHIIPRYSEVEFAQFLLEEVAKHGGMSVSRIQTKTRKHEVVITRFLASLVLWRYTNMTLKSIGVTVGGKDHTTVIHGMDTIKDLFDTNDSEMVGFVTPFLEKFDKLYPVLRRRSTTSKHNI
jgi:Bacterial dnaA protein helix-turn-helix